MRPESATPPRARTNRSASRHIAKKRCRREWSPVERIASGKPGETLERSDAGQEEIAAADELDERRQLELPAAVRRLHRHHGSPVLPRTEQRIDLSVESGEARRDQPLMLDELELILNARV